MKNKVVITGGAGFVGSNLIEYFLLKTQFKIISIDNYSSGFKKNHIKNKRVKYIKADTKNISQIIKNPKNIIDVVTGSLALFPASLLHYTIPFESEEERIVLAFDVIPK